MSAPAPKHPLEFWHQLECLIVQAPQRPRPWDRTSPVYLQNADSPWPWEPVSEHAQRRPGAERVWGYSVQAGVFSLLHLHRQLYQKLGISDLDLEESVGSAQGRLLDFRCDSVGRVLPETFTLSLGAFGYAQAITQGLSALTSVPERFQELYSRWRVRFAQEVGAISLRPDQPSAGDWRAPANRPVFTTERLLTILKSILQDFGVDTSLFFPDGLDLVDSRVSARSIPQRFAPKPEYLFALGGASDEFGDESRFEVEASEEGLINSFFLDDLRRAISLSPSWGQALRAYLSAPDASRSAQRLDVRSPQADGVVRQ